MPGWMPSCFRGSRDDDEEKASKTGSVTDGSQSGQQNGRSQNAIPEEKRAYTIVELEKRPGVGFGLTVSGGIDKDGRPRATNMRAGGVAQRSDLLQIGDLITAVNGIKTAKLRHEDVINLLKNAGDHVSLEIEYEIPPAVQDNGITVTSKNMEIKLAKEDGSFGFVIRGGVNANPSKTRPLTITHIRPGGPADRDGTLKVGDRILSVDGINLSSLTHMEALNAIKLSSMDATFRVEYDVSIMEAVRNATGPLLVEVAKTPGANLGVTLSALNKNSKSILVIDAVKPASIADRCGALHVGDEIMSIDGTNTSHMSVPEATQLLATSSEQIKLEILPVSHMTPRLTYPREHRQPNASNMSRSITPVSHLNNSSYNSLNRSQGTLQNSRQQATALNRKMRAKNLKASSTLSLTSTINGIGATTQVCRSDTTEVTLYSRNYDFGFTLQGGVFTTEILGSPAIIGFIEPGGKADRSGVMQVGDRIVTINNKYTDELTIEETNHVLRESGQQCTLLIEFDVAESVVPSSGIFSVKLPVGDQGLGITLSAPKNRKPGDALLISDIKKGSVAHRTGTLEPGDHLLAIDDIHLETFSVEEAAHILRQADDIVKLRVKKDETFSEDPDISGAISFTVELIRHGGPLGITISGTEEPFDPIVISALTEGGLAERTGALHIGDRLLAINGTSLRGKTLSAAIRLLQNSGNIVTLKISKQDKKPIPVPDKAITQNKDAQVMQAHTMHHFNPVVSSNNPTAHSTPIGGTTQGSADSWEGSGLDTGYHSTNIHNSRSNSRSNSRTNSPAVRRAYPSPARKPTRQRRMRSSSRSTSPNDASEDEIEERYGTARNHSGANSDPLSSDQEDGYRYNHLTKPSSRKSSLTRNHEYLRNIDSGIVANGVSPESNLISPATSYPHSTATGYPDTATSYPQSPESSRSLTYHYNSYSMPAGTRMMDGYRMTAMEAEINELLAAPATPTEIHRVTLYKDSDVEDFGFSVSDGVYEPGVFVNTVRPGGPAARSGNVKPFDRILQINQTRTRDFDCCMVVPLIAESGNQLELSISRSQPSDGNVHLIQRPPAGTETMWLGSQDGSRQSNQENSSQHTM
ncbi:glutamate receptor-interacting protein 1-like isoform X2 [Acanthaster planci]|uniref:Glutamate receptor-interacting protein 1-like isoform X2 n=1 Tax=Acanthaster planci TaxID=133434 RepID=A0A8B7ZUU4_ACAPL|nr:glutamate receptor-interacting protein 1-like isoform X2 [Acanthaster planci]